MPRLASITAHSLIGLGITRGSSVGPYWLGLYDNAYFYGSGDVNLSNGDIVVGVTSNGTVDGFGFALLNSAGAIKAYDFLDSSYQDNCNGAAFDSTGKIIVHGFTYGNYGAPFDNQYRAHIYSSSGVLSSQIGRSTALSGNQISNDAVIDANDNIVMASYAASGDYLGSLMCFTQANSVNYTAGWTSAGGSTAYSRKCATSPNLNWLVGAPKTASEVAQLAVFKTSLSSTSGFNAWRTDTAPATNGTAIAADSSDNAYAMAYTQYNPNASTYDCLVIKFNSSLTPQWWRRYWNTADTSQNLYADVCCCDASGNFYFTGSFNGGGSRIVAKVNSSGTLQWVRAFTAKSGSGTFSWTVRSMKADTNDDSLVITGYGSYNGTTYTGMVMRYPQDGSKLGDFEHINISNFSTMGVATTVDPSTSMGTTSRTSTTNTGTMTTASYTPTNATVNELSGNSGGEHVYNTAGTYSWTAPAGVTSVSVVAVGGGGTGTSAGGNGYGSGGGGLGWKNSISVTPGNSYTVVVDGGADGGSSYFINTSTVAGHGGNAKNGGGYVGDGGGNGGSGSDGTPSIAEGSGGGAGGYSGNGGNGGYFAATAGQGGGGGGGSARGGGGVGIYGEGTSGAAGDTPGGGAFGSGAGGSGGQDGADGGLYGGGRPGSAGREGAVRIIWGDGRAFPSTNVDEASSLGNVSTN